MLKHRFSLIFFLTLALLGSQWVFAAHDHDGDWLHGDTDCPLCMHAVQFAAANAAPSVAAPPPAGAPDGAHAARIKPALVMAIPLSIWRLVNPLEANSFSDIGFSFLKRMERKNASQYRPGRRMLRR